MTYALSAASLAKLNGVHPDLAKVVLRAIQVTSVDFKVIEGVRSDEQCYINYGKGRTVAELKAKGVPAKYAVPGAAKVTWLANPLNSKHRKQTDGFGRAVDLLPAPYAWKDGPHFDKMADAMKAAAIELNIAIRHGADWDGDGNRREKGETDLVHFELSGV